MEILNKIIHYNKYIYKVVNFDKKYYYLNALLIDNDLILEYDFNEIINFTNIKLLHFEDKINEKEQLKIKSKKLKNYVIIDDINNYYLCNDELKDNYNNKWSNVVDAWDLQGEINVKYFIALLSNGKFKRYYKKEREHELYIFCLLMCNGPPPIKKGLSYYDIIVNLEYQKIFNKLKEEAINNEMRNFELIKNEFCPVCLSTEVKNYKGLYKCCHHSCYNCYMQWKTRTCPLCRAKDNYINA